MTSILNDLYYGRISPWERKIDHTPERQEINRKIEGERRYFTEKMSLDDCQRFQLLEAMFSQFHSIEQQDAFSCGFRLGILLMAEVFTEA